ncbi:MAG: hypothetical protein MJD61_09760 [Proteobacteria bacterium]|nr:hypothetical protein [Pseudomonadota bacterium]
MSDPKQLSDARGEWFELYVASAGEGFNLRGCELGSRSHVIDADMMVESGDYITMARSAAPGFVPDYVYSGLTLSNSQGTLSLVCRGTLIDEVSYDRARGFQLGAGASLSLDPVYLDAHDNDRAGSWCQGMSEFNGDRGTPGRENSPCPPKQAG